VAQDKCNRISAEEVGPLLTPLATDGDRVLDLGCGGGVIAFYLEERRARVTGVTIFHPRWSRRQGTRPDYAARGRPFSRKSSSRGRSGTKNTAQ
jgi:hypothetical protein